MKKKVLIYIVIIILAVVIIFGLHIYMNKKILDRIEVAISELVKNGNFRYEIDCSEKSCNLTKIVYNNQKTKCIRENSIYYVDVKKDLLYLLNVEDGKYGILSAKELRVANPEVFENTPPIFNTLIRKIYDIIDTENVYTKLLFNMKISDETLDGVKCYKITNDRETEWFNKETLMPVKYVFLVDDNETTYNYEFLINTVKESDVLFTDIDNYEMYENEQ